MFSANDERCPDAGLGDVLSGGDRGPELANEENGDGWLPSATAFFKGVPLSRWSAILSICWAGRGPAAQVGGVVREWRGAVCTSSAPGAITQDILSWLRGK